MEDDLATLTDADEIAAEILELGLLGLGLQIERAVKVADQPQTEGEGHGHGCETNSTVVIARTM